MESLSLNLEPILQQVMQVITVWGLKALGGLAVLIAGYIVAGWARRRILSSKVSKKLDPTLVPTIGKVVHFVILGITLVMVLSQFDVEIASLLAVLGAAGLAIGLALQGTLSNVAAGIILLTLRPFEVGDTIDIGQERLVVDEIGLIMTKLHRLDNVFVALPNSQLWGREIANYTRHDTRRIDMVIGISYGDDIDRAIRLVEQEIEADERILKDPAPLVAVGALADSSVNLLVRPWVKTPDYQAVHRDLTKRIKQRFDKEGVSIPFPQRDVHLIQA